MKHLALALMLVAGTANAQSDGIGEPTRRTPAAYASPPLPAHLVVQPGLCDSTDASLYWLDASDPSTFAGSSLAQLTNDDAAFLRLGALVQLRFTFASLRLFVVGASPTARVLQVVRQEGRWKASSC